MKQQYTSEQVWLSDMRLHWRVGIVVIPRNPASLCSSLGSHEFQVRGHFKEEPGGLAVVSTEVCGWVSNQPTPSPKRLKLEAPPPHTSP